MSITQTIEVPVNRRIVLDVPPQIPMGQVIITFTPKTTAYQIVTAQELQKNRQRGCVKGDYWMAEDFDAPLEDFKDYM